MPHRSRLASRLTLWAFAAALVLKSGVPLLAAAAAGLQGKQVADVCAIYGVRLAPASDHVGHTAAHATGHMAAMDMPAGSHAHTHHEHDRAGAAERRADHEHHEPADPAAHAQDHCALTALAAGAVEASTAWTASDWRDRDGIRAFVPDVERRPQDASARWLILRLHAPPLST